MRLKIGTKVKGCLDIGWVALTHLEQVSTDVKLTAIYALPNYLRLAEKLLKEGQVLFT